MSIYPKNYDKDLPAIITQINEMLTDAEEVAKRMQSYADIIAANADLLDEFEALGEDIDADRYQHQTPQRRVEKVWAEGRRKVAAGSSSAAKKSNS